MKKSNYSFMWRFRNGWSGEDGTGRVNLYSRTQILTEPQNKNLWEFHWKRTLKELLTKFRSKQSLFGRTHYGHIRGRQYFAHDIKISKSVQDNSI